jgi:uncharacterized membrane protein YdfJ with MMPL/SSD domain
MKKAFILCFLIPFTVSVFAAGHPNLRAAQDLINQAFVKVSAAQKAKGNKLGGYAAQAKEALANAQEEIKLAAEAADTATDSAKSFGAIGALFGGDRDTSPAMNVLRKKHRNLAEAQDLIYQAHEKIRAAQHANEFDMEGHAKKALDFLASAADSIKKAAEYANSH